jgi:transposase-like protein
VTEQELARGAARRLAIIRHAQEVIGNVSATCRYYRITRQAFYNWLSRYDEHGLEGLRDGSRRPHTSPNATKGEVVGKIVPAPALPLRALQDLDVPQALPRRADLAVGRLGGS